MAASPLVRCVPAIGRARAPTWHRGFLDRGHGLQQVSSRAHNGRHAGSLAAAARGAGANGSTTPATPVASAGSGGGLSVYVHWPFCAALCTYCDFNKYAVAASEVQHGRMRRCLVTELQTMWAATGRGGPPAADTLFFGGGTPSLAEPETIAALVEASGVRGSDAAHGGEVTLELNPTRREQGRLQAFFEAGVNRLSIGVQALDDASLVALGRRHTAREALSVVEDALRVFDGRVSVDL